MKTLTVCLGVLASVSLVSCGTDTSKNNESEVKAEYAVGKGEYQGYTKYMWLDQYITGNPANPLAACYYFATGTTGKDYDLKKLFLNQAKPAHSVYISVSRLKSALKNDIALATDPKKKKYLKAVESQLFFPATGTQDRESLKLLSGNIHELDSFGRDLQLLPSYNKMAFFEAYLKQLKVQDLKGNVIENLGSALGRDFKRCPTTSSEKALLRAGYQDDPA